MIDLQSIIAALTSHAATLGVFDSVNGHEPKSVPGFGMTYSIWVEEIKPALSSGLASTSVVVTMNGRIYTPFKQQPEDSIDPNMVNALDLLLSAYSGNFTLGGIIRSVDIRGAEGQALESKTGYLDIDRAIFRIIDIMIPCIINDVWTETP